MRSVFSTILMTAIVACHSLVATHVHFDMEPEKSHSHGQQPHFHLHGCHSHGAHHHGGHHHHHEREAIPGSTGGQLPDSDGAAYCVVDSTVTTNQRSESVDVSSLLLLPLFLPCVAMVVAYRIDTTDERCNPPALGSTARTARYLRDCSIRC
jgi:hypothetical protein